MDYKDTTDSWDKNNKQSKKENGGILPSAWKLHVI